MNICHIHSESLSLTPSWCWYSFESLYPKLRRFWMSCWRTSFFRGQISYLDPEEQICKFSRWYHKLNEFSKSRPTIQTARNINGAHMLSRSFHLSPRFSITRASSTLLICINTVFVIITFVKVLYLNFKFIIKACIAKNMYKTAPF